MANAETTKISFDNTDVAAASRSNFKQLKTGWMKGRVTKATSGLSKADNHMCTITFAPLDADGDVVKNARATYFMTLPLRNKDVEGHSAPKTAGICYGYFVATQENVPRYPRKDKETEAESGVKQWIDTDKDATLTSYDEVKARRAEIDESFLLPACVDRYNDPETLVDDECFIFVEASGDWRNVKRVSKSAPEDAEVIEEDFFA